MTTFYLIRHGDNDWVGKAIAGRSPGVYLNAAGRQQAQRLAEHLAAHRIQQVFSSPLERARETAEPLAGQLGLEVQIAPELNELEFGQWTGKTLAELDQLESWKHWNTFRSGARIPDGESMLEAQARMVSAIETWRRQFPQQTLALFSHGDPIRAAAAYYLGMPLDMLLRLEISPAAYAVFAIGDWGAQCLGMNLSCSAATIQDFTAGHQTKL